MPYTVHIKRLADGEVRTHVSPVDWGEASQYWWSEGSMGCDCNLHKLFEPDDANDVPCGETLYVAVKAVMDDGTEIPIREEIEPWLNPR